MLYTSLKQASSPHNTASGWLNVAPIHHLHSLSLFHQQEPIREKKSWHIYLSCLNMGADGSEGSVSVTVRNVERSKNQQLIEIKCL